jgi:hypothetical protein
MGHGTCGDGLGGLGFRLARSFFVLIRIFDLAFVLRQYHVF